MRHERDTRLCSLLVYVLINFLHVQNTNALWGQSIPVSNFYYLISIAFYVYAEWTPFQYSSVCD
jgi:hypothetical protein